jgi:hypothetical protein
MFCLCLLGAVHVFIFSAAFPFFSVVDEQMHLDLAVRYAHADFPRTLTPPTPEALPFIVLFGTPEFLGPPARTPDGAMLPPAWKRPMASIRDGLLAAEASYMERYRNHEAASPPLYYSLAGGWWRFGRLLKLDGIELLYWMRFLNVPVMAAIVWLGWLTARLTFPESGFICTAVPALLACLPQTAFYAINNDVLTPLTFGATFLLALRVWAAPVLSPRLAAATGLAFAAAYLTKTSNLPLLAVTGILLAAKGFRLLRNAEPRTSWPGLLTLGLTAALPMAAWLIWCKLNFGDFTGSQLKIRSLGWTDRPVGDWFQHPLFSLSGGWYFLSHNLASFWQGEQLWHRAPLASPAVDSVYVVFTLGTLALTLAAWLEKPSPFTPSQRAAVGLAFLCLASAFVFFAWLSVKYDFQDCFYPSRAHPYFVSGRLMLGALIPVLLLFACGLDRLLRRCASRTKFLVLIALLAFMAVSEFTIDGTVFANEYNWFHQ